MPTGMAQHCLKKLHNLLRAASSEGAKTAQTCPGRWPAYTGWYAIPVAVAEPLKYTRLAVSSA